MDKDFKTTQSVLNDAKEILLNEDNVFPSKEELIKKVKNNTLTIREAIQLHYYSTKNKIKIPPRFSNEALGGDKEFISQLSDIQSTSKDNATFKNNIAGIKTLVNSFRKADIDIDNTLFKDLTPTDPETGFISPDVLKNYQSKVLTDAGKTGQGRMLKLKQIESGIDSVVKVDPSITFRKDINILSDERVGIPGEKQRRTRGKDAE